MEPVQLRCAPQGECLLQQQPAFFDQPEEGSHAAEPLLEASHTWLLATPTRD